ncbi:MAG: hypothetical protein Q4G07_05795 [Oscillospiraceae bacterium]|nr:hypothetical protein [Oscillospiraceae bacterium]
MKKAKKERLTYRSHPGSAILWAVQISSILFIIITALLLMALGYTKRSVNNGTQRQAYQTARSTVDMIVAELESGSQNSKLIYEALQGHVGTEFSTVMSFENGMGSCTVTIKLLADERRDKRIYVRAVAESEKGPCTVSATLFGAKKPKITMVNTAGVETTIQPDPVLVGGKAVLQWIVLGYTDGEELEAPGP